jgi:2-phospho-L-lactate guanylyltransferase
MTEQRMHTTAILPVKRFDGAYQRLAGVLNSAERRRLAEATFQDTLSKIRRSRTIDDLLVVTADAAVERHCGWLGYPVLKQESDSGHSEAAAAGAQLAQERGAERVAMLPIDCPLLDPAELDAHMGHSPRTALIIPDAHGTGTNGLILCPPDIFPPAFGPDSCSRHIARARAAGISFALERLETLGPDLDTPEDMEMLRDALLLDPDPAPRTAKVLWELGASSERPVATA